MTSKHLPRLNLELLQPAEFRQRRGVLIMLVGVVLALVVTGRYMLVQKKVASIEVGVSADTQVSSGVYNEKLNADEVKAVQVGIAQLAMPWGGLFTALESIDATKITVIFIEPDAHKGTVKIVAEAPDAYDMLDCIRGLVLQPKLKDVLLESYEIRTDDDNLPMRFTLSAVWVQTP